MFKSNLKPHRKVMGIKKAQRIQALAFFLCMATLPFSHAQTNWVSGTAYGTNDLSIAAAIASLTDGAGSLAIGSTNTTSLILSNSVNGYVVISNNINNFSVTATKGTLKATNTAALEIHGGSNLILNGGTFTGGTNAAALFATNTSVTVEGSGKFTGGNNGAALKVIDSKLTVNGNGTFTGGTNAAALFSKNSDLTINDGTFKGGAYGASSDFGLVSFVDAAKSNNVVLNGGTFNSIDFGGDGTQFFTAGTNLTVSNYIFVDGGMVIVTNQSDDALQDIRIRDGSMSFVNDFTLSPEGSLALYSGTSMASFSSLTVASNATAWVGTGKIDVANDFSLLKGGMLSFSVITNMSGMLTAGTASFETNSTIQIDATQAAFSHGTNYVTFLYTSGGITGTNNFNIDVATSGRTIYNGLAETSSGNGLGAGFITQTLTDYWSATGQLGKLAGELENNSQMSLLIDQYNDPTKSAMAVAQTYFTTFNNFQSALLGIRSAIGQSQSRSTQFREQLKLIPPGAKGPEQRTDLQGWVQYYGNYITHDSDGLNPAYDSWFHGGSVGMDTGIGNLLVGLSGGSSQSRIMYDVKGQSDTLAYHGNLYGTYGMNRGYIDGGLAYSHSQTDTRTGEPFVLEGSFDADLASGYLGGGYDLIDTKGGTVFTPEASIQYSVYQQEAYKEESKVAVPRVMDDFDADSLLGTVGMNFSMLNTKKFDTFGIKVDGRLHWLHEFNPDPSNMTFMLQDGSETYHLTYPALDEDLYRIGIGCTFFNTIRSQPKNVLFRIDIDELFGDGFNSHNIAGKVVYAF